MKRTAFVTCKSHVSFTIRFFIAVGVTPPNETVNGLIIMIADYNGKTYTKISDEEIGILNESTSANSYYNFVYKLYKDISQ